MVSMDINGLFKTTPTNTEECLATTVPDSLHDNCVFKSVKQFYLTNKKQFKIAHLNVDSIRYKIKPFHEVLNEMF